MNYSYFQDVYYYYLCSHGLVGHLTQDTAQDFKPPVVIAYYNVDYIKNIKGTNYWRNRVLKVRLRSLMVKKYLENVSE